MARATTDRLKGRNGDVWQAALRGHTQEQIAAKHGISQQRVSQIMAEVRASIPETTLDEVRRMEADRIALLYREALKVMEADHPLVSIQRGTIIRDEDTGQRLTDDGPKLQAITVALRISERIAKAYGTDAPSQSELQVTGIGQADADFADTVQAAKEKRAAARAATLSDGDKADGSPDSPG